MLAAGGADRCSQQPVYGAQLLAGDVQLAIADLWDGSVSYQLTAAHCSSLLSHSLNLQAINMQAVQKLDLPTLFSHPVS